MDQTTHVNTPELPKLLISGIDSLYVSYYLDGLGFDWEDLDYRKEQLKQDRRQDFTRVLLGGQGWNLMPYGKFPYAYTLRNEYFQIFLAKNNSPNCYVQFQSKGLWTKGVDWLHNWLLDWFDELAIKQTRTESVSRVDFAFDFDLPVIDFKQDDFISRAAKDSLWRQHGTAQSFIFGSGTVVLRLYDKVAEIEQQSEKYWFYDLWGQEKNVWRIEFQIRSNRLKKIGINSLEDMKDFRGDILRELAIKHTSLRQPTNDINRSRWPYHPLWKSLLDAIDQEPQTGLIETFQPANSLNYSLNHQLRSFYGDIKGLGSLLSVMRSRNTPMSFEKTLELLPKLLEKTHHPILWTTDVQKRMDKRRMGQ